MVHLHFQCDLCKIEVKKHEFLINKVESFINVFLSNMVSCPSSLEGKKREERGAFGSNKNLPGPYAICMHVRQNVIFNGYHGYGNR